MTQHSCNAHQAVGAEREGALKQKSAQKRTTTHLQATYLSMQSNKLIGH
jgi:hypothetical protein